MRWTPAPVGGRRTAIRRRKLLLSMNTLISISQLLQFAFGSGEYLPPDALSEADITAAEQRYLLPVIGQALYEKLLAGEYATLRDDYLARLAWLGEEVRVLANDGKTLLAYGTLETVDPWGRAVVEGVAYAAELSSLRPLD